MVESGDTFSLAKALRETGFSASVVTTFNAYLPFYEEVVLRRLVAAGCTNNIVLMDARQCAEVLAQESTRPQRAGVDYTLVPVSAPGAFHPKVLLRVGKRKGSLFVGSHNLTVAGFGMNDELTNRFEYDAKAHKDDIGAFAAVIELLRDFMSASPSEVAAALDAAMEVAPWLSKLHSVAEDVAVLGSHSGAVSLWEQIRQRLPENVRRVLVLAPFFDEGFIFVRQLYTDLGNPEVVVALDPDTAHANAAATGSVDGVRFVDARNRIPSTGRREGITPYLHAKALVFEADEGSVLVTGSGNASGAAFLAPRRSRNTECIIVRTLSANSKVLDDLGLRGLFHAPELTSAAWDAIASRLKANAEHNEDTGTGATAVVAVFDGERFRLDGVDASRLVSVIAIDADGAKLGPASVDQLGPPAVIRADAETAEAAAFLILDDGSHQRWALVHRPANIAEHFASDTRRALRQALGSLEEDPAQLAVLLKLSEKVIFDDDAILEKSDSQLLRSAGQKRDGGGDREEIESLALDAAGRRVSRKRRSIASGDITVILDALIHRLGSGGTQPAAPGSSVTREEEQIGADDDTDELPPEQPDFERLGAACRRKTHTLLKRMTAQLEAACENGASRRAIIQVAAVLGILRALRVIELRDEWRRSRQRLLHEGALQDFFWAACPLLAVGDGAIIPAALEQIDGQSFEELSIALGLMVWLAWECEVDVGVARAKDGWAGVEEDQWSRLQCVAYLAPHCAADDHALELAVGSVRETPRRGQDGDAWFERHQAFMRDIAAVIKNPAACARVHRPPRPGDIVCLAPQFEPRVRLVVNVQRGSRGDTITVVDEDNQDGERKFIADRVERLSVPAESARDVG